MKTLSIGKRAKALKIALQLRKQAILVMRLGGYTWPEIETELDLRAANGMTAWRGAGKRHRKTKQTAARFAGGSPHSSTVTR